MLEAPPRLTRWSPELWREATVFNGQYQVFEWIGGPLDLAAVLLLGVVAWRARGDDEGFRPALAAAVCYALALGAWFGLVAPANGVLATWRPGPIATDFYTVRDRWETGHMVVAALKLLGFVALALSAARSVDRPKA